MQFAPSLALAILSLRTPQLAALRRSFRTLYGRKAKALFDGALAEAAIKLGTMSDDGFHAPSISRFIQD